MDIYPIPDVGIASTIVFVAICLAVTTAIAAFHVAAVRKHVAFVAAAAVAWLSVTFAIAAAGLLLRAAGSPAVAVFPIACAVLAVTLAMLPAGRAVARSAPLWALVGLQGFRVPLEWWLHHEMGRGSIPPQMTWSGQNLDVVAGVVAIVAALVLARPRLSPRVAFVVALVSNIVGLVLLLNVARVALRSVPGPLQAWPDAPLILPLTAPFAWIVSVCVAGALWGHVVVFRAMTGRGPLRQ